MKPSPRSINCSLLLLLAMCLGLAAGETLTPGLHQKIPFGDGWTCDVLVPDAAGDAPLPVLFLFSAGGNPDVRRWKPWADTNTMLVVGLNDSHNNIDAGLLVRMQKEVSAAIEPLAKVHPFLRYSTGFSGGGWCAMLMARTMGDAHAGVLVQGHLQTKRNMPASI